MFDTEGARWCCAPRELVLLAPRVQPASPERQEAILHTMAKLATMLFGWLVDGVLSHHAPSSAAVRTRV